MGRGGPAAAGAPRRARGRLRRTALRPAAWLATWLAVGIAAVACSRGPASEPPEDFPESYAPGAVLRLFEGRLSSLPPDAAPGSPGLPSGIAPAVAAAAAVDGRTAALALNRVGLVLVRIDPERRRFRIEALDSGDPFDGRSVGGLFVRDGTLYCLLYRDPLFETRPPRDPPSVLLAWDPRDPESRPKPFDLGLGSENGGLFALFPRSDGSWALQFRKPAGEGFESSFRMYSPASGSFRPLTRGEFEQALSPRLLSLAPDALRRAARLLAPEGVPVIVSAALADGSREAYVFGEGPPEDTVELRGAAAPAGAALVSWNAVAATARDGTEAAFRLPVPMPGAVYRDIVPLEGAILAVWEVGVFPDIEESGVVLLPAP
ncbi:MAG: hypothetical protein GX430_06225 [Treponema sp.]|nr:hypothetical protein [Treponema sp.]